MDPSRVTPVVLCGGSGTRLWPVSRSQAPKQFVPLLEGNSLFQETALRAVRATGQEPVVVCHRDHRFVVEEQLEAAGVRPRTVICEPVSRNTAPAVAVAAAHLTRSDPQALLLVLPSDHLVPDSELFSAEVATAALAGSAGHLVTFGIAPTQPHTGYGYIRQGAALAGLPRTHTAERFVEKPSLSTAQEYVVDQKWLWNSGMFLMPAQVLLAELDVHEPAVRRHAVAAVASSPDCGVVELDPEAFGAAPDISLDYAVMERTERAAVLPTPLRWSDVGSWSSLWEVSDKDEAGNAGHGDVLSVEAENCYLHSDGPLVAALGLRDVTVVATRDAVLVADLARSQEVRGIVDQLRSSARTEADEPKVTHRPWGTYESVHRGARHQVKHLVVRPGQKLSLQRHQHRSEQWVVVRGVGRAVRGPDTVDLAPSDTLFIPQGCVHRLENPGIEPLHLIEVQLGSYLGEDDIERLDDAYGRR